MTDLKPQKNRVSSIVKRFLRSIAIILALILISATFTFFKPIDVESIGYQYYNDRTYRVEKTNQVTDLLKGELIIRRKVNEIKTQTTDPQRQIDLALSWVTQYLRPQDASPSPVISDDYYNILKRGSGYCDQAAYVFSVLSTRLGIPARMTMLQDRDGVSRHTAAEVYLDSEWQYIDPWLGVFPHKSDGSAYTRFEFAKDQSALVKYGYTPELSGYDFSNSIVFETFPFMSFGKLLQKIVSKLGNLHESSAANPGGLSNVEQTGKTEDFSSSSELTRSQVEVLKLYDKSRTNHLNEDFVEAKAGYQKLMNNVQVTSIAEAARFFLGVTYFDQHMHAKAEKYFKQAIAMYPNDLWKNSEYRFLSESLIAQGKIEEAKIWLKKSTSQGARARLENLDQNVSSGWSVSFVSH
jgi:tetratricopeptide (TPR) repeat protein